MITRAPPDRASRRLQCPGRDSNPYGPFEPGGFKFLEVVFTSPSGELWGRIIPARSLRSVPPVP